MTCDISTVNSEKCHWRLTQLGTHFYANTVNEMNAQDRARYLYNRVLRHGWEQRKPCEICGAKKAQGHHIDYTAPYQIRWLCRRHHSAADWLMRRGYEYSRSLIIEHLSAKTNECDGQ